MSINAISSLQRHPAKPHIQFISGRGWVCRSDRYPLGRRVGIGMTCRLAYAAWKRIAGGR